MIAKLTSLFSARQREARLQAKLAEIRQQTPVPVFWLFGKTQSGKTSLIKYLTGAEEAEIGQGFKPCTRFSRQYQFPTPEAPLLDFLDTRGMDEPGYDPAEDLAQFDKLAHLVIVTVKVTDHAQERVIEHLRTIRRARPSRPVLLLLTCLHEAYPQQQHPMPFPFLVTETEGDRWRLILNPECPLVPPDLTRTVDEQQRRFDGLVDRVTAVDLTRPEEGYTEPNYGGELLKQQLLASLPSAYRQTLITLDKASRELQDFYAQSSLPHIIGYSSLAATAGAIPIPWLDLFILPGIQTQMISHLAQLYGQPLTGRRFGELAGTLGLGMMTRQAVREVVKFIPYVGSVAGAALAGASTFALGKAFCYYYSAVHKGHVPRTEDLRRYYQEQLALAEKSWGAARTP
ncbi:MAG: DUF697 domain-containing protein [Planctomycetia bacterium]|nr:DUF697 domain-containing protein [Planctomycetia bacterium]